MQPDHGTCSVYKCELKQSWHFTSFTSDHACQLSLICTRTVKRAMGESDTPVGSKLMEEEGFNTGKTTDRLLLCWIFYFPLLDHVQSHFSLFKPAHVLVC